MTQPGLTPAEHEARALHIQDGARMTLEAAYEGVSPPLKWHGGKHYLASRIIAAMPPHTHYVEAFAGGLSVLLAKNPAGVSEVVNDLDGWLTNFWAVMRDPEQFAGFRRRCEATPFSQPLFEQSLRLTQGPLPIQPDAAAAYWFFVKCRMSMAGRMKSFAPLSRNRVRRGMNEQSSAWMTAVDGLPEVHGRMFPVVVLNMRAVKCIKQQDGDATLHYLDPPYFDETRASPDVYTHEMTRDDHVELLETLPALKGKVMLSGYDCPLYSEKLREWNRLEFDLPNNAAGGDAKRRMIEVVWCNFTPIGGVP